MQPDDHQNTSVAARAVRAFKETSHFTPFGIALGALGMFASAFAGSLLEKKLQFASAGLTVLVLALVWVLVIVANRLHALVKGIGATLMRTDYIRVNGIDATEATIYDRATKEIEKATRSIEIFTSYLVENENPGRVELASRRRYFNTLIRLVKTRDIHYSRIVQLPGSALPRDHFQSGAIASYYTHLVETAKLQRIMNNNVGVWMIDQRRPTTYVIIDSTVLLWQINQTGASRDASQTHVIHGMFIISDPTQELITHFIKEFREYLTAPETERFLLDRNDLPVPRRPKGRTLSV